MYNLVVALVIGPLLAACGVLATYAVWVKHAEPFKWGGIFAAIVGHSGRFGYDAFTGFAGFPMASGVLALVVRTLQDQLQGERTGFWNSFAVGAFWLTLAGLVVACSLLLFMQPRLLVPPHLRGKPGWVLGAWRDHRAKQRRRSDEKRRLRAEET